MKTVLKIFAVILGFLGYTLIYFCFGYLVALIFNDRGIIFLMQCVAIFIGGAITGSLIQKHGWLYGLLSNALNLTGLFLGMYLLLFKGVKNVHLNVITFNLIVSIIGGVVGEKYSFQIRDTVSKIFVWISGISFLIVYIIRGLVYLYILYLSGKVIFENREIFKGLFYIFILGPLVSGLFGLLLYLFIRLVISFEEKINKWYPLKQKNSMQELFINDEIQM